MMHRLGLLILGWAMLVGLGACVSVQVTPYDLGVALQDRGELPAALEHYKPMVLVSYKPNSAIERGTKPDALGSKPCHWTSTLKSAMLKASRAWKYAQTGCMTFLQS